MGGQGECVPTGPHSGWKGCTWGFSSDDFQFFSAAQSHDRVGALAVGDERRHGPPPSDEGSE